MQSPNYHKSHGAEIAYQPLLRDRRKAKGYGRYLTGVDGKLIDQFATLHAKIECPVFLIWGEDDPTFPLEQARRMTSGFQHYAGLHVVKKTKLLPHEERLDRVLDALYSHFGKDNCGQREFEHHDC